MPNLFGNPAHLHLLLNHIPLIGLGVATLGLLLSIFMKNRGAQIIMLVLVVLTSLAAWPVEQTGENAFKGIRGIADDAGTDWLDTHLDRADQVIYVFYVTAALGVLAIFLPQKVSRSKVPLLYATLIASMLAVGAAVWIADAGGKIRHNEIRTP